MVLAGLLLLRYGLVELKNAVFEWLAARKAVVEVEVELELV
jgi:hypothetical protein